MTEAALGVPVFEALRIEFEPDVWLKAPSDPAENADWVETMVQVHATAYDLEPGSADVDYLRRTLSEFADGEVGPPNKFLRLAGFTQTPLVVTVAVVVGLPTGQVRQAFERYDDDLRYYDPPRTEVLDEERGLVRALRYVSAPDGTLTSSIRYHRRDDDLETDVVVVCEGGDIIVTAQALDDLDRLAAAVSLVDSAGARS